MRSSFLALCGIVALAAAARVDAQQSSPSQPAVGVAASQRPVGVRPVGVRAGRRGARHGTRAGALVRGISLSDAQRAQLADIERRYRDERRGMRGARPGAGGVDSAARAAAHERARGLRARELADMRGVLTPAQQGTFDRNVQDWQAGARQRHAARLARGPMH